MTSNFVHTKIHPVETQWHYPILVKHGFVALTPYAQDMLRSYNYEHPNGTKIRCCTGVSRDYWEDSKGSWGLWAELEVHAKLRSQGK